MSDVVQILEFASAKPAGVDRATFTIKGVKLLGEKSGNPPPRNNDYPRSTREKAIALIEGSFAFLGHQPGKSAGERPYAEKIGRHTNVRETGEGVFGDFKLNPKHPLAEAILWDAENDPSGIAFSVSGKGRTSRVGGRNLVEEITSIQSVDLVVQGGTVKGLFENRETAVNATTLKDLLEALKDHPARATALKEMADMAGMPETAEAPTPGGGSPEEQLMAGFEAAIVAVIRDKSMDVGAKKTKIGELLKMLDKAQGGGKTDKPEEKKTDGGKTQEGLQGTQGAGDSLQEHLAVRDLCDDAGLKFAKPDERRAFVKSLVPLSEAERKTLIESRKAAASPPPAPVKSGGVAPIKAGDDRPPQNAKEAARRWGSK